MQTIDLEHGAVRVAGALDLDRRPTGITPRRLPDWTRPQVVPVMELRITQSSGVRLELLTTSTVIELEVLLTRLHMLGRDLAPATFDLVVEGELVDSRTTEQGDVLVQDLARPEDLRRTDGEPTTLRFEGLAPTLKRCELWLPPNATAELRGLRVEDGARVLAPERSTRSRWIHHGSSISHCTEAHSPTRTWPVVAARRAQVEVLNLGFGGQCHLDPFVARTIRDEPGDVVSLKLGINVVNGDTMRERTFVPAVHGFLDTIREGKPATPDSRGFSDYLPLRGANPRPYRARRQRQVRHSPRARGDPGGVPELKPDSGAPRLRGRVSPGGRPQSPLSRRTEAVR